MKPKRPSEADLLALVQNGFNTQLPQDREAQRPVPDPAPPAPPPEAPAAPADFQGPLVRITLTIPEELRYQLKLALMERQRTTRTRMTQDAFCVQAIQAHLARERGGPNPASDCQPNPKPPLPHPERP